jgi:hypothetical protein
MIKNTSTMERLYSWIVGNVASEVNTDRSWVQPAGPVAR